MMDKVRAALFDMLWHFSAIRGRTLDLYAGSGAVGMEALSRGAEFADFVEWNPVSVRTIQQNLDSLGLAQQGRVHRRKVEEIIAKPALLGYAGPYDLISVTPPYIEVDYAELSHALAASTLVGPGTVVVFEYPREIAEMPDAIGALAKIRDRQYGRTRIAIYESPWDPFNEEWDEEEEEEEWEEDEGWEDEEDGNP